ERRRNKPAERCSRDRQAQGQTEYRKSGKAPRAPARQSDPQRINMVEPALALNEQMDQPEQREPDQRSRPWRLGRGYAQRGGKRKSAGGGKTQDGVLKNCGNRTRADGGIEGHQSPDGGNESVERPPTRQETQQQEPGCASTGRLPHRVSPMQPP